jgi:2-methylcitrate dehydratase PrpD
VTRHAVTARLAELAVEATAPDEVRHAGRRTLLNAVALSIGASDHPVVRAIREVLAGYAGDSTVSVFGRSETLPSTWAAMVNATGAHVEDFDDTHLETMLHPGASVVPAALAAGELVDADATGVLDAVCVGVEVATRIGRGVAPAHFERGWHPSGTVGHLGAAAAAGRILGLDVPQMRVGLGLAGTQAAGLLAALGTMTKALHLGKAAGNGLEAALLAQRGFTGPVSIVEGRRGFGEVAGPEPDYDVMLEGLGSSWDILDVAFKPFACGIVSHPVLEAARALHEREPNATWSQVDASVNPMALDVTGIAQPRDGLESKFSLYHCVAVGLAGRSGGPASFSDQLAVDRAMEDLRSRVRVETRADLGRDEAILEAVTVNGQRHRIHIEHATGSQQRPMDDVALAHKACSVAEPVLGAEGARTLTEVALSLGNGSSTLKRLMECTRAV